MVVVDAIYIVVEQFYCDFKVIEFSIYAIPKDSANFEVFNREDTYLLREKEDYENYF